MLCCLEILGKQEISPTTWGLVLAIAEYVFFGPRCRCIGRLTVPQVWPRQGEVLESLNRWTDVLRSYCNVEDPLCAGGDNSDFHLNYFDAFSTEAGVWVREQVAKKNAGEV